MNLLRDHLTRLRDFSGRENRQPFWLWMLAVYLAQMALGMIAAVLLMSVFARTMTPLAGHDQAYLDAHPEIAMQLVTGTMLPLMRNWMLFAAAMALLTVALIGAATVRRLHDGDRSGWWAAPVFALQVAAPLAYAAILPRFFGTFSTITPAASPAEINAVFATMMPVFALTWLLGMIGFVLTLILFIFLVLRGTVGPNRYGDDLLPPPPVWTPPPAVPTALEAAPVQERAARVVQSRAEPPAP